jgi:hypothetical protein
MNKKILLKVLKEACKYADGKDGELPVLKTAHIMAANGHMIIESTNLDKYFICDFPVSNQAAINACIPAKTFRDLINVMDNSDISIGQTDEGIVISQGYSRFVLYSINPDEYPTTNRISERFRDEQVKIDVDIMAHVYHFVLDDSEQHQDDHKIAEARAKNIYPKYLLIDGQVATRNSKVSRDWKRAGEVTYYYSYTTGQGDNSKEQKIMEWELENYEPISMKKGR